MVDAITTITTYQPTHTPATVTIAIIVNASLNQRKPGMLWARPRNGVVVALLLHGPKRAVRAGSMLESFSGEHRNDSYAG